MTAHHPRSPTADRDLRRAWLSFVLFVPSLVAAFITGEGLLAALGHSADEAAVPAGAAMLAGFPAIVVFALPTLVVWHFGRHAQRQGNREGRTPILVALVICGAFLALNLLQLATRLFG